jgi:hypothetical protein
MRRLVVAALIASCDQGTYGPDSFIEVESQTVSDWDVPPDLRRIKISGDGTLVDEHEQQETRRRQISPRRFAELVRELKEAGFLTLSHCDRFNHGRHTTLTLNVPEGHNEIHDAPTCDALRAPIEHILELANTGVGG